MWVFEHTNIWAAKVHLPGEPRFKWWLRQVKLAKLYDGRPNGLLRKKRV